MLLNFKYGHGKCQWQIDELCANDLCGTLSNQQSSKKLYCLCYVYWQKKNKALNVQSIDLILFIGSYTKCEGKGLFNCSKNRQDKCYVGQMVITLKTELFDCVK